MDKSVENKILVKVKKAKKGMLFFTESFISFGSTEAIKKALQRLTNSGELERLATGIYYRPVINEVIGKITPSLETVAIAIAQRDRARIVPTGSYALNRLGLSTQVPLNIVYLTDGSARKIKIGRRSITFKKTSPKNLSALGEISGLAIQALKEIGKEKILDKEIKHIQELLKKEKPTQLEHDIKLAPAWIREIMKPVLQQIENE